MILAARLACALAAFSGAFAFGQSPVPGPERRAYEQKESLVRRLVLDSPAEQRIQASGNEDARMHFAQARAQHARAVALAESGSLKEAETALNAAMWSVGNAHQLVPDAAARAVDQRVRYASLARTVETLAGSYEANLARAKGLPRGSPVSDARLEAARARVEEARALASSERDAQAVVALEKAERELMAGLNGLLGSATIRYATKFESPDDEYAWELERNRSYRELVPVALAELKPRREAVTLVERYVATNRTHLADAERLAGSRQFGPAIDALRSGTTFLQAALAAAGLVMPKDAGASPP
ncbi:MAG: hypothetical protein IPL06_20175 [Betaproteobacteria bacterium]|nr:hypothetical protein [Betaproteobacteria bacterium]